MIEWWIDIPNLQTVDLPDSFQIIESKSITSICMNMNEWIDVSPILANFLPFTIDDIESLDSNITSIQIPDYSMNNENYNIFDFSRFNLLEELEIGNDCFMYVNEFILNEYDKLKSLKIGDNSFTEDKSSSGNDSSRSFSILNCNELESIEIGRYSFIDYAGGFELRNLPHLNSIELGYEAFEYSLSTVISSIWMIWMNI